MGLMDMFSVRDIRSFGTGFLGARVESMQESARVKAAMKEFKDKQKSKRIGELNLYNDKADADATRLEEIRVKESNRLQAKYADMNPDLFQYLLDRKSVV